MPFIDLNTEKISFKKEDFDFLIVGCGAAGILLAVELTRKKKKVLVIESGHFFEDAERQELNEVVQTGKELANAVWGRKRAIGGTTIAWGGQSLPFGDIDFEKRSWVNNSGWPIVKDELNTYYKAANRFMGIDEYDYDDDIFSLLNMKKLPFDHQYINYHFSKWAPEPNFKKLYQKELSQHVTVVYNAVVKKINIDGAGRAENITITNFTSDHYRLDVQQLILTAGTIETIRLLFESNTHTTSGLGNSSGWLGKCFMEHPCLYAGDFINFDPYKLQRFFNTHVSSGRKYSIRMSLSEQAQRGQSLLNCSGGIMFDYPDPNDDPYANIKKHLKAKKLSTVLQLGKNLGAYSISAKAYAMHKFVYKHKSRAKLVLMAEQEPIKDSCIAMSNEQDRLGMRKAIVNWEITNKTWHSVVYTSHKIRQELQRMSLADLQLRPEIYEQQPGWSSLLSDVNHQMGGARMSTTAAEGVVNKDLQVWGHDNVHICSSAVFPASSHSNPTLTMMALGLRLSTHLLQ